MVGTDAAQTGLLSPSEPKLCDLQDSAWGPFRRDPLITPEKLDPRSQGFLLQGSPCSAVTCSLCQGSHHSEHGLLSLSGGRCHMAVGTDPGSPALSPAHGSTGCAARCQQPEDATPVPSHMHRL